MSNFFNTGVIANTGLILIMLLQGVLVFLGSKLKLKFLKNFYYLKVVLVVFCFALLIYAFINSNFSLQNVFLNSSSTKPLIYKISGSWASHEGSMLLFLTFINLVCALFIYNFKQVNTTNSSAVPSTKSSNLTPKLISLIAFIELLFTLFIYFTSNPFIVLSFTPTEGLGLNPVLQDVALAIHPPILYLGIACYTVPFVSALVIMRTKNFADEAVHKMKLFSSLGLFCLTIGVGLGSWWAYRELGWGGFWFFDPVENISLLPWLVGIALHHSLIMTFKSNDIFKCTLCLSVLNFLLCIFGTFLVRSGLLISVHSFSDAGNRGIFLFCIFLILGIFSGVILIRYLYFVNPILEQTNFEARLGRFNFLDKIFGVKLGIIFLILATTILLFTITYPIIYRFINEQAIALEEPFFWHKFLPVFIPILFLAAIFTRKGNYKYVILITSIFTLLSYFIVNHTPLSLIFTCASIYLISQTLFTLFVKSNNFKKCISAKAASMIISHLGFGALVLFITFNSLLKTQVEFIGSKGSIKEFDQFTVSLKNISYAKGPNYLRQIAEFWVEHKGSILPVFRKSDSKIRSEDRNIQKYLRTEASEILENRFLKDGQYITILKPENRFYTVENAISMESDIFSYLFYDLYAVLSKVEGDVIYAQIYYRPLMSFIWLSVWLIAFGFLISTVYNINNKIPN